MMDFLYDLCYMLPLNIVVILSYLTYFGMQEHDIAGCIAGSALIVFVRALRHAGKKERFLISGIVSVALAGFFFVLGKEKRAELFIKYSFLIWVFIAALVCMLVGRIMQEYLWAGIAVLACLIGNAVYLMFFGINISKVAVAGSILVMMIFTASLIQTHWEKSGYTDLKTHISLITPVMLIVFILVSITPAPDETFDWSFAVHIWNAIVTEYNRVTGMFSSGNEEYEFAGFSEDGSLGSNVLANNKEIMVIHTDGKSPDRLYLGGIIFEDFGADGWKTDITGPDNYRQFDLLETRAAIIKYSQGYERDYIHEYRLETENRLKRANRLFLPGKVNLDNKTNSLPDYSETADSVISLSKLRYGDSYSLVYYGLNYSNEELAKIIDQATLPDAGEWNELLRKASVSDREDCSLENFRLYKQKIQEEYGLSVGLSDAVAVLVDNITAGIDGDYERVRALADYLQTFNYDTQTGSLPDTVTNAREYLDYFLLESKRGFCVHYATAMVLLARECGYPARYVQGYYVNVSSTSDNVTVYEQNAHSWAEVYFDNFGWVMFEATPGYSLSSGWHVDKLIKPSTQTGYKDFSINTVDEIEEITEEESTGEEIKRNIPIRYFAIPVLSAAFFGAVYLLINRLITKHKYRNMNFEEKVRFLSKTNFRILKLMGYPISSGETIEEFKNRVQSETEVERDCLAFLSLYEKLLYSDYAPAGEDVILLEQNYKELKTLLHKRGLRFRFYIV